MQVIKRPYLRQKINLYFDENFPIEIIEEFPKDRRFRKRIKISSAYELKQIHQSDDFHFTFCKQKGYVLVTLDADFMDDNKYPFSHIPGIIRIVANKNEISTIRGCLAMLLDFLPYFPRPKQFMGDSKFQVSLEGCVMRGRDTSSGEIKTVTIKHGDTVNEIGRKFSYIG